MKKLIFLFIFASQFVASLSGEDSSELVDCQSSFELGKQDARQVRTCKWFWTGWAISSVIGLSGVVGGALSGTYTSGMEDEVSPIAIAEMVGMGCAIILPLFLTSQPKSLPNESAIDIDCYKKGYRCTLRGRNFLASLGGIALGWGTIYVITFAIGVVLFASSFGNI